MENLTAAIQTTHKFPFLFLIPLFPFLGAVLNAFFGKRLQDRYGKRVVHTIGIGSMTLAATVAVIAFVNLLRLDPSDRTLLDIVFPMIDIGAFKVDMAFAMDPLSGMMTLIITLIGTGIHVYSTGYMADEPAYWRFFCYLNLFVFSMLLLVLGDSMIIMFFGWEGVGLCSYLLIGFWYKEKKNASAGMKAFVVNRVGDWGFITGAFLLFWGLGGGWSPVQDAYVRDLPRSDENTRAFDDLVSRATVEVRTIEEVEQPAHEAGEGGHGEHAKKKEHHGDVHHVGRVVQVPIGPTVSFRELRNQLAITTADGRRPLVEGGTLPVTIASQRPGVPPSSQKMAFEIKEGLVDKTVWGIPLVFLICLCFFIGATGKSAQLPLYVWLPDAMAGPTPVSALIHAATMVTAGVYMVVRLNFLFVLSPGAMTIVATVGALTALFAATIGLFQYDIKKVLAYSTVSQLGFMFIGVGVGAYWAGAFHLLTHACFKACLFLGAGSVIHGMHHLTHHREHAAHGPGGDDHGHGHHARDLRLSVDPHDPQDMRNMGGLASLMPWTRKTYLIACWAIAGFPWAAGFFSKDEILWKAFSNGSTLIPGPVIWLCGLIAATCTSFYMFRSYYMTFYGNGDRGPSEEHKEHVHESPKSITYVLWALAIACLIIGPALGLPALWTGGHFEPLLEQWLEPVTQFSGLSLSGARAWHDNHALEAVFMLVSCGVATAGWWFAKALYFDLAKSEARLAALRSRWSGIHSLVFDKYRVDEVYNATVIKWFREFADLFAYFDGKVIDGAVNLFGVASKGVAWLNGAIDKYFVDGAVNFVAEGVIYSGEKLRHVQTGRINHYLFAATAGAVVIVVVAYFV
ncbi:MAG: NADH-quinone oxidoreductase subunit L [Myxococcales bacterium]|nr:NADH-quinone oxidoreductase subunit L [Myxococcales bacterium]